MAHETVHMMAGSLRPSVSRSFGQLRNRCRSVRMRRYGQECQKWVEVYKGNSKDNADTRQGRDGAGDGRDDQRGSRKRIGYEVTLPSSTKLVSRSSCGARYARYGDLAGTTPHDWIVTSQSSPPFPQLDTPMPVTFRITDIVHNLTCRTATRLYQ